MEDPNGDSCIWEIDFEVVPLPAKPRHYLLRWNPSISSFKENDYKECVEDMVHGMFRMNCGALLPEDIVKKLEEIDDEEEDDFPLANKEGARITANPFSHIPNV